MSNSNNTSGLSTSSSNNDNWVEVSNSYCIPNTNDKNSNIWGSYKDFKSLGDARTTCDTTENCAGFIHRESDAKYLLKSIIENGTSKLKPGFNCHYKQKN